MVRCAACFSELSRKHFAKSQLKKSKDARRCKRCVKAAVPASSSSVVLQLKPYRALIVSYVVGNSDVAAFLATCKAVAGTPDSRRRVWQARKVCARILGQSVYKFCLPSTVNDELSSPVTSGVLTALAQTHGDDGAGAFAAGSSRGAVFLWRLQGHQLQPCGFPFGIGVQTRDVVQPPLEKDDDAFCSVRALAFLNDGSLVVGVCSSAFHAEPVRIYRPRKHLFKKSAASTTDTTEIIDADVVLAAMRYQIHRDLDSDADHISDEDEAKAEAALAAAERRRRAWAASKYQLHAHANVEVDVNCIVALPPDTVIGGSKRSKSRRCKNGFAVGLANHRVAIYNFQVGRTLGRRGLPRRERRRFDPATSLGSAAAWRDVEDETLGYCGVCCMAFSARAGLLLTGASARSRGDGDATGKCFDVRAWHLGTVAIREDVHPQTRKHQATMTGHGAPVLCLAVLDEDSESVVLASGSQDRTVRLWRVAASNGNGSTTTGEATTKTWAAVCLARLSTGGPARAAAPVLSIAALPPPSMSHDDQQIVKTTCTTVEAGDAAAVPPDLMFAIGASDGTISIFRGKTCARTITAAGSLTSEEEEEEGALQKEGAERGDTPSKRRSVLDQHSPRRRRHGGAAGEAVRALVLDRREPANPVLVCGSMANAVVGYS